MLGAKYNGLRDVTLGEFEKPTLKPNSVIIKNLRAGICGTDITGYTVDGPAVGIHPGNQFGHEMVGVVDEIGENVTGIEKGTIVFVHPNRFRECPEGWTQIMSCDMAGASSQYVLVDEPQLGYNLFEIPSNVSLDAAALVEPLSVSMNGALLANPKETDNVIIYGAGPIGLGALASLQFLGVKNIIVADTIPLRLEAVEKMGAIACDVTKHNINEFAIEQWGSCIGNLGQTTNNVDIVVDCAGYPASIKDFMDYAKIGAKMICIAMGAATVPVSTYDIVLKDVQIISSCAYTTETNNKVIEMLASGKDVTPIISDVYPLTDCTNAFIKAADSKNSIKVVIDHTK